MRVKLINKYKSQHNVTCTWLLTWIVYLISLILLLLHICAWPANCFCGAHHGIFQVHRYLCDRIIPHDKNKYFIFHGRFWYFVRIDPEILLLKHQFKFVWYCSEWFSYQFQWKWNNSISRHLKRWINEI